MSDADSPKFEFPPEGLNGIIGKVLHLYLKWQSPFFHFKKMPAECKLFEIMIVYWPFLQIKVMVCDKSGCFQITSQTWHTCFASRRLSRSGMRQRPICASCLVTRYWKSVLKGQDKINCFYCLLKDTVKWRQFGVFTAGAWSWREQCFPTTVHSHGLDSCGGPLYHVDVVAKANNILVRQWK